MPWRKGGCLSRQNCSWSRKSYQGNLCSRGLSPWYRHLYHSEGGTVWQDHFGDLRQGNGIPLRRLHTKLHVYQGRQVFPNMPWRKGGCLSRQNCSWSRKSYQGNLCSRGLSPWYRYHYHSEGGAVWRDYFRDLRQGNGRWCQLYNLHSCTGRQLRPGLPWRHGGHMPGSSGGCSWKS